MMIVLQFSKDIRCQNEGINSTRRWHSHKTGAAHI